MATTHEFMIRVITEDGELVYTDTDFNVNARWDWFGEVSRDLNEGEIAQLIDTESDYVLAEQRWDA